MTASAQATAALTHRIPTSRRDDRCVFRVNPCLVVALYAKVYLQLLEGWSYDAATGVFHLKAGPQTLENPGAIILYPLGPKRTVPLDGSSSYARSHSAQEFRFWLTLATAASASCASMASASAP